MYIHRVVIDANRINTRGGIPAMNSLEALHAAGLVEIFQTSTLPVEFRNWPRGKSKASNYTVVGGGTTAFLTGAREPDSWPGTPSRDSRFTEIRQTVFGAPSDSETHHIHDMRDALHIDQANQNHADFFITHENVILAADSSLRAKGFETRICSAEACLQAILDYFANAYGTIDVPGLAARLEQSGPILIGSNSCGGTEFVDNETGESLLAFLRTTDGVSILANIRTADGRLALSIAPSTPLQFQMPGLRLYAEVGPSPIQVGDNTCRSFSIIDDAERPVMAARLLRNQRLLLYQLAMYSQTGRLAMQVERSCLMLSDVTPRAVP